MNKSYEETEKLSNKASSILSPGFPVGFSNTIDVAKGKEVFERIITDSEIYYFICPFKVGDTIVTIGYAKAVQEQHGYKRTKLVLKKSHKLFASFYEGIYDYIQITENEMFCLACYCVDSQKFFGSNWLYAHFQISRNWDPSTMLLDRNSSILELWKKAFKLPDKAAFVKMKIELSEELMTALIKKYKLSREKTIILMPMCYSFGKVDNTFWEMLAKALFKCGYTVYTNIGYKNEVPIKYTEPLFADFKELYFISKNVKAIVSSRSGINDFLVFHSTPMIILYPDDFIDLMMPDNDLSAIAEEMKVPFLSTSFILKNTDREWLIEAIISVLDRAY